jgi:hypothetical protein
MPNGPSRKLTIANGMIAVAAVALVMGIALTPGFAPILGVVVIPSVIVGVFAYLAGRRLVELAYGYACPGCGERALERRGLVSFGERFFLCTHCGVRCQRSLLGIQGMFNWRDASAPEFAAMYEKPREQDPWNAPPDLEDGDEVGLFSKTHMNLVRNKRRRTPENPNGPGLG